MADTAAAGPPAKHSFGHLARRPMADRMRAPAAAPAPIAPAVAPAPKLSAQQIEDAALSAHEGFEERAAIMEFDGGMTREDAESAARVIHPLRQERQ